MKNKIKKLAIAISGMFLLVVLNLSISNNSIFGNQINLKSLIKAAMAQGEGGTSGCSMCGSGNSTCSVSCDGGTTWTTCTNVKGIETVN